MGFMLVIPAIEWSGVAAAALIGVPVIGVVVWSIRVLRAP